MSKEFGQPEDLYGIDNANKLESFLEYWWIDPVLYRRLHSIELTIPPATVDRNLAVVWIFPVLRSGRRFWQNLGNSERDHKRY